MQLVIFYTISHVCFKLIAKITLKRYRRMANTCEIVPQGVRDEVVDNYAQKLLNFGHKLESARKIIIVV